MCPKRKPVTDDKRQHRSGCRLSLPGGFVDGICPKPPFLAYARRHEVAGRIRAKPRMQAKVLQRQAQLRLRRSARLPRPASSSSSHLTATPSCARMAKTSATCPTTRLGQCHGTAVRGCQRLLWAEKPLGCPPAQIRGMPKKAQSPHR